MKIGLFGGTFDPPHLGHLIVAQDVFHSLSLDRLLFLPAAAPPHKRHRPVTAPTLRLEMLRAAIGDDPRFGIEEIELRRAGPSYTVDTLEELAARAPDAELFFLLGEDQFRDLATWRSPDRVARLARMVVLSRDGADISRLMPDFSHQPLAVTRVDLSSTEVRERVRTGRPIRYLVPAAVEALIMKKRLYRDEQTPIHPEY